MSSDRVAGTSDAAGSTSPGAHAILLVHGRDFKPAAARLAELSVSALRAGIARDYPDRVVTFDELPKDLAYFGDLTNALLESQGGRYDESLDLSDRQNALKGLLAVPARRKFGMLEYDRIPGKSAVKEFVADVAAPLLGSLGLTMPLLSRVSKDSVAYLSGDSGYADAVRHRVRAKLCELLDRNCTVLLMTHGTGCIVAYDVLWELSHDPALKARYGGAKIDTWVTLGAPLGDRYIRKSLFGAGEGADSRFPTNVISWHNVAAEDDYTCHDSSLTNDFRKMLEQRLVSTVHDYRIYNLAVRYGKSNPHSSLGYYIHPRVSKIIADWMPPSPAPEPIHTD